jgi:hypothetical protein
MEALCPSSSSTLVDTINHSSKAQGSNTCQQNDDYSEQHIEPKQFRLLDSQGYTDSSLSLEADTQNQEFFLSIWLLSKIEKWCHQGNTAFIYG